MLRLNSYATCQKCFFLFIFSILYLRNGRQHKYTRNKYTYDAWFIGNTRKPISRINNFDFIQFERLRHLVHKHAKTHTQYITLKHIIIGINSLRMIPWHPKILQKESYPVNYASFTKTFSVNCKAKKNQTNLTKKKIIINRDTICANQLIPIIDHAFYSIYPAFYSDINVFTPFYLIKNA